MLGDKHMEIVVDSGIDTQRIIDGIGCKLNAVLGQHIEALKPERQLTAQ